jgi:DNA replication protein DnaC
LQAAARSARRAAAAHDAKAAKVLGSAADDELPHLTVVDADTVQKHDERMAAAERYDAAVKCWGAARVPDIYKRASLTNLAGLPPDAAEPYAAAAAALSKAIDRPGIYALVGEVGAGKSHMACALVREFCKLARTAVYTSAGDYIRDYRSTWKSNNAGAEAGFEAAHVRPSLLVIDEWTARADTPAENITLFRLIDKRYAAGKTTVLIGNQANAFEFTKTIDARINDRLCERGGVIVCAWPSVRGRIAEGGGNG